MIKLSKQLALVLTATVVVAKTIAENLPLSSFGTSGPLIDNFLLTKQLDQSYGIFFSARWLQRMPVALYGDETQTANFLLARIGSPGEEVIVAITKD
jgi:hypothetical protein